MTTIDSLDQFLEGQFQAWGRQDAAPQHERAGPVVAISREPGCGGERIARTLAEALGLVLYDGAIIERIAQDTHVSEKIVATLDEKIRSEMEEWLGGLTGKTGLSTRQYLQCLHRILFAVASHGNAVIVGRGANFVLPREKITVGLCLVAPREVREKNIMQERICTREAACAYIARIESERQVLVREMGHADIAGATNYHLVLNTAWVETDAIIQIVQGLIRRKKTPA